MSRRTVIILWLLFPVCALIAVLYAGYLAKDMVGMHRPLLSLELDYITVPKQGRAIREFVRDLADSQHWVLTDASEKYSTTAGNPELHLEVNISAGSMRLDSFYTRAPARLAYYGDVRSPELQGLIIKSVSGLQALGLKMTVVNAGALEQLPEPVRQVVKKVGQGR